MSEQAAADVLADFSIGRVLVRFFEEEGGPVVLEVQLEPDTARDLAFTLTKASIAVEEDQR